MTPIPRNCEHVLRGDLRIKKEQPHRGASAEAAESRLATAATASTPSATAAKRLAGVPEEIELIATPAPSTASSTARCSGRSIETSAHHETRGLKGTWLGSGATHSSLT
jgi:hypothetical protein